MYLTIVILSIGYALIAALTGFLLSMLQDDGRFSPAEWFVVALISALWFAVPVFATAYWLFHKVRRARQ